MLDDFTAAIDVGDTLYGDSNAQFIIEHIEWIAPSTVAHTAVITKGDGDPLWEAKCSVQHSKEEVYFDCFQSAGIKIAANGVGSGKIYIYLK